MRDFQPLRVPAFDQGAHYHILLRGQLDPSWLEDLAGMAVTITTAPTVDLEQEPATLLTGWLLDQAALYGLLQSTYYLGLTILNVKRLDPLIPD